MHRIDDKSLINEKTIFGQNTDKGNEVLDRALTPQDAGYLKPQEGIGSLEEIMEAVKCP